MFGRGLVVIASASYAAGQLIGIVVLLAIAAVAIRDQVRKHRTGATEHGPSERT